MPIDKTEKLLYNNAIIKPHVHGGKEKIMKIWKKTLALVMALGMTAGFAACGGGGKGDKEPAGEQLQGEGAWVAAWEATLTATNVTIEGSYCYSFYAKKNIWGTMDSEGTIELADGKVYTEGSYTQEYDYSGQGHDKGKYSGVTKCYTGMQDGVLYDWSYDEETKEWDQEIAHYDADTFGTAFGLVESNFDIEMDRYDYLAWEALAVYEDGVYTLSFADEDDFEKYQFKFVDGKLYSFDITMTAVEEEGYTETIKQSYVISYGDAKIGKLPYEEGFENEKPEEGGDVGGGTVGGEEIGGGNGNEEIGGGMATLTQEEWSEIVQLSCNATNLTALAVDNEDGVETVERINILDNKFYSCSKSQNGTLHEYIGNVDGEWYVWRSEDEETWTCEPYANVYDDPITAMDGSYFFNSYDEMYEVSKVTYNKEIGEIIFDMNAVGMDLVIRFHVENGRIIRMESNGLIEGILSLEYGNATNIELPPFEGVSEGDNNADFGGDGSVNISDNNAILK